MGWCRRRGVEPSREIALNDYEENKAKGFCNNTVVSSKYTILTFLPVNLFEQFHRLANCYFFLIACLQQIPNVSPLGTGTTAMTLAVVLTFTALKEAWEDKKRHDRDREVNRKEVAVLRNGLRQFKKAKEVEVGDILRLCENDFFPADMVLLGSSDDTGMCYIETKNLDGETNLKERKALDTTKQCQCDDDMFTLKGSLTCEGPNNNIHDFLGHLSIDGTESKVDISQVLLTGCQLKITDYVYGLVVYTGNETKLKMQTRSERIVKKTSKVEHMTNKLIILIFLLELLLCLVSAVGNGLWLKEHKFTAPYLGLEGVNAASEGALSFVTFLILYSNLIPISLYVSMETVKMAQATLINYDIKMYYEPEDMPTQARTSNLNEELGQVEYIFSDKTGTLTCNNLIFTHCSINGKAYGSNTADLEGSDRDPAAPLFLPGHTYTSSETAKIDRVERLPPDSKRLSFSNDVKLQHHRRTHVYGGGKHVHSVEVDNEEGDYYSDWYYSSYSYEYSYTPENATELQEVQESSSEDTEDREKHAEQVVAASLSSHGMLMDATAPFLLKTKLPHVNFYDQGSRFVTAMLDPVEGQKIESFMLNLALNHTVIPRHDDEAYKNVIYQCGSPDEEALVMAAKYFGIVFVSRTPDSYTISIGGRERTYKVMGWNHFDNTRKRMSIVLQTPEGEYWLYIKGADSSMTPFTTHCEDHDVLDRHLSYFAESGLRTLVFGERKLTDDEFHAYAAAMKEAQAIDDKHERKRKLKEIYKDVEEKPMTLSGATAIEDKLQDYVPETIARLRRAGIKVWVLTGDKQETAIQIGHSCNLLSQASPIILNYRETAERAKLPVDERRRLARETMKAELKEIVERMRKELNADPEAVFECVLDGLTMQHLLGDPGEAPKDALAKECVSLLLEVSLQCKSVIGCRVSPAQKAQVVNLVKDAIHPITLAIGDGANDVVMIQAAHIGIGIAGKEGQQAANSADYSFGQFRFLLPLLLVHGHWCYHRISKLILYSFYKNIALALVPFWFVFFCGYSGQTFVEKWTFSLYNVVFTALPILVVGLYDQCLSRDILLREPKLYESGIKNRFFTYRSFIGWFSLSIYHSLVCFFGCVLTFGWGAVFRDGITGGLHYNGMVIMSCVVLTVTGKMALETNSLNILNAAAFVLSIGGFYIWVAVYSYVGLYINDASDFIGIGGELLYTWNYWTTCLLMVTVCLLPDVLYKFIRRTWWFELFHIFQEVDKFNRGTAMIGTVIRKRMNGVLLEGKVIDYSPRIIDEAPNLYTVEYREGKKVIREDLTLRELRDILDEDKHIVPSPSASFVEHGTKDHMREAAENYNEPPEELAESLAYIATSGRNAKTKRRSSTAPGTINKSLGTLSSARSNH